MGSSPSDDILDFSLVFSDFGFYRGIDFLRGMVEWERSGAGSRIVILSSDGDDV